MARRNQSVDVPETPETTEEVTVAEEQIQETVLSEEDQRVEARAQELAEQKFQEWKAAEQAKKGSKKPKPEKRKPDLPEGWIAPVAFRHALVEKGLAPESMSPVQIYGLVRKASSNGMPVKHFDREGNQYDEIQTHPVTGETVTRPGLKLDEGLAWWENRPKRQPGQKKAESSEHEAENADETTSEDEIAAAEDEFDGEFAEAE